MITSIFITTAFSLFASLVGATNSCSGVGTYAVPDSGACIANWSTGDTYVYPDDFEGLVNEVTIYSCPISNKRVIISNGIPDHTVVSSVNLPCEKKWAVSMPLNPTQADTHTEIPARSIIGMATNGVPAYGAQESEGSNAVEQDEDGKYYAQFWYGHAAQNNDWHLHNPYMGKENPSSTDLLGYALDGFPIYGPLSDDSGLDACNGQTVNGQYQYHVRELDQVDETLDYCNGSDPETNWNYILGCYAGSTDDTKVVDSDSFELPADCVEDGIDDTPSPTASPVISSPVPSLVVSEPPTVSSTSSPVATPPTASSACNDSPLRFKLTWNGSTITRYCTWVANKSTTWRCSAEGVTAMCPNTCNACDTCADSENRFKLTWSGETITRSCTWVANKSTTWRCSADGVTDTCRSTCGQCE